MAFSLPCDRDRGGLTVICLSDRTEEGDSAGFSNKRGDRFVTLESSHSAGHRPPERHSSIATTIRMHRNIACVFTKNRRRGQSDISQVCLASGSTFCDEKNDGLSRPGASVPLHDPLCAECHQHWSPKKTRDEQAFFPIDMSLQMKQWRHLVGAALLLSVLLN